MYLHYVNNNTSEWLAVSGTWTTFFPKPAWASSSSLEPLGLIFVGSGRTKTTTSVTLEDLLGVLNLAFPLFPVSPENMPGKCLQKRYQTMKVNQQFQLD